MVCDAREKDVDIAFAQDAIDEFKVLSQLNLHNVYQILFVPGWKERKKESGPEPLCFCLFLIQWLYDVVCLC